MNRWRHQGPVSQWHCRTVPVPFGRSAERILDPRGDRRCTVHRRYSERKKYPRRVLRTHRRHYVYRTCTSHTAAAARFVLMTIYAHRQRIFIVQTAALGCARPFLARVPAARVFSGFSPTATYSDSRSVAIG